MAIAALPQRSSGRADDVHIAIASTPRTVRPGVSPGAAPPPSDVRERRLLDNWLAIQGVNLARHARSLRPFDKHEFGTGPTAPSEVHIEAVNRFIEGLRLRLSEMTRWVQAAADMARRDPTAQRLQVLLERKEAAGNRVLYVEGIWDF